MKKLLILSAFIPALCFSQWNSLADVAYIDQEMTITADWNFTGTANFDVVVIDSMTIEYINSTYIEADSILVEDKIKLNTSEGEIYANNVIRLRPDGTIRATIREYGIAGGSSAYNSPLVLSGYPSATTPGFTFISDRNTGVGQAGDDSLSLIAGGREGLRIAKGLGLATVYIPDGHLALCELAALPDTPCEGSIVKTIGDSLLVYINGAWLNILTEARATP